MLATALDPRQQELLMTLRQSMGDENKIYSKDIHSNNKIINIAMPNRTNDASRIICKRGEIFYSDLAGNQGSEQGGIRPVIIIQNDIGNKYSPTVIVAVVTSQLTKSKLPTHLELSAEQFGLPKDSVILFEQIRTLDKRRLREKVGILDEKTMTKVDKVLGISVGITVTEVKEKTLLERLPNETKQYVMNKIRFIERAKESIDFYKSIKGDKYSIRLAEDEKFREKNALQYFCYQNNINYNEIYNNYIELVGVKEGFIAI